MSEIQVTVQEVVDSLTGFEEMAIDAATGQGIEYWTGTGRRLVVTRIMAAIIEARKVAGDKRPSEAQVKTAYQMVQGKTQTELAALFEDEEDEPFEDDPVTPQGKDGAEQSSGPESSPGSASEPE